MRKTCAAVLMVAAMISAPACRIGPNQPYLARDRFGVIATGVATIQGSPQGSIRLERVRVSPPFDGRAFVYQKGDLNFEYDYFNQFVAMPSDLLTAEVFAGLNASRRFEQVLPPEIVLDTPHRLEVTVTRLVGDFRDRGSPQAVIAMRVLLLEVTNHGIRVLAQDVIEESEPIPSPSAEDLTRGWGKALGRSINTLGEWAGVNLPKPTTP
jgi:ABC-type uncharacterized transport system auxiliary subunit